MKKFLLCLPILTLIACDPVVTDGDLKVKVESLGYSKVLIQPKRLNCGRYGQGKQFIGTKAGGSKVIGQICYLKAARDVQYKVSIIQNLGS